jgi:hypothetical protein
MKKYFLILIFLSQFTNAQDLKLECNLLIETRYSEGGAARQQSTVATVDVEMNDSYKFIKIANHKIIAIVSSIKLGNNFSFVNKSDAGKWEMMMQDFDERKNEKTNTIIRIDRNTGKIFFNDRFTDSTGYTNLSGAGDCTKVDLNKRKF